MPPRPLGSRCGALVIDSMPPATTTVELPEERASKAIIAAFMPEPHILLTVVAGVDLSSPAPSAAWRAGAWPWPAPSTLPKMRSSTSVGFTPACSTAALIATAPSWDALTELNLPCIDPMGVRFAPTMAMLSAMYFSLELQKMTRWSVFFLLTPFNASDLISIRLADSSRMVAEPTGLTRTDAGSNGRLAGGPTAVYRGPENSVGVIQVPAGSMYHVAAVGGVGTEGEAFAAGTYVNHNA